MKKALVLNAALLMCMTGVLSAQTNDVQFGSWRWSTSLVGPEGAGVSGAVVAEKNEASIMALNPATLSTLRTTELFASGFSTSSRNSLRGDTDSSTSGIGPIGGAAKLTPRLAIGGYVMEPRAVDTTLSTAALPDGTHLSGNLKSTVTDVGLAVSYEISKNVHVGGQGVWTHLKLEGEGNRFDAAGNQVLFVGTSAGQDKFVGNFGVLVDVDKVTLGFAAVSGASWDATRTVTGSQAGPVVDASPAYQIRRPAQVSGGFAWQATLKVRVLGQVDYVDYGQVTSGLWIRDLNAAGGFSVDSAVELRAGAELSLPLSGGASVQFRAGLHDGAANAVKYLGTDPVGIATFPGSERKLDGSAGASYVTSKFALHAAASGLGGDAQTRIAFGASLRF